MEYKKICTVGCWREPCLDLYERERERERKGDREKVASTCHLSCDEVSIRFCLGTCPHLKAR